MSAVASLCSNRAVKIVRWAGCTIHPGRQRCGASGALLPQENYFFDSAQGDLNSRRVVLRVRFYNVDQKARLTLKVWCCPSPW